VREPQLSDRDVLALASEIASRLPADGYLAIHDRVYLAASCGAHAVHLGFRSLTPSEVRQLVSDDVAIGLSAHAHDSPSVWNEANYLFFGPVFDTPSKRGLVDAAGLDGLARAVSESRVPVLAIGGLTPEHAPALLRAGARGMAVRRGVFGASDPAASTRAYLGALGPTV
jgi:thiamine-phosphate diphosphorylase